MGLSQIQRRENNIMSRECSCRIFIVVQLDLSEKLSFNFKDLELQVIL